MNYKFPKKLLYLKEMETTSNDIDTANLDRFIVNKKTIRFKVKNFSKKKFEETMAEREVLKENVKRKQTEEAEENKIARKVTFKQKRTMQEILKENREILKEDNIPKKERYVLRRMNLLAIQDKFYDVMERHPEIFNIPLLMHHRKITLRDRKYGKLNPDFIDFEPDECSEKVFKKSKKVK